MRTRTLTVGFATGLAVLTAACGSGDDNASSDSAGAARRIEIAMVDIAFEPSSLTVTEGDEVELLFTNDGKVRHEAYVGTPDDQVDHAEEMAAEGEDSGGHDDHGGGSDDKNKITVEPGKSGELTYRFDKAGSYEIGCHEPGHYDAGMKITVVVT
jgi:uncharacterized cupredoxin-like copper-binding protein